MFFLNICINYPFTSQNTSHKEISSLIKTVFVLQNFKCRIFILTYPMRKKNTFKWEIL